jgi:hypothetical protein
MPLMPYTLTTLVDCFWAIHGPAGERENGFGPHPRNTSGRLSHTLQELSHDFILSSQFTKLSPDCLQRQASSVKRV